MTAGGKQGGRSKADVSARRRATIWQMHNRGNGVREIARRAAPPSVHGRLLPEGQEDPDPSVYRRTTERADRQ